MIENKLDEPLSFYCFVSPHSRPISFLLLTGLLLIFSFMKLETFPPSLSNNLVNYTRSMDNGLIVCRVVCVLVSPSFPTSSNLHRDLAAYLEGAQYVLQGASEPGIQLHFARTTQNFFKEKEEELLTHCGETPWKTYLIAPLLAMPLHRVLMSTCGLQVEASMQNFRLMLGMEPDQVVVQRWSICFAC